MPSSHRTTNSPAASPQRPPPPPPPPPPQPNLSPTTTNTTTSSVAGSSSPLVLPTTTGTRSPTRQFSLQQPSKTKNNNNTHPNRNRFLRRVRSAFRSFPTLTPTCRIPVTTKLTHDIHNSGHRVTGTLFGYRKARINLAFQENPRCLPTLLLELAIPTGKLLQDMGLGLVRIALECEKQHPSEKTKLVEEPIWSMYCNGRKTGYGIKREPTDEDLSVMTMLRAVSMGAGVLPSVAAAAAAAVSDGSDQQQQQMPEGELTYMRAYFERVVGSRDSETYYMVNPDGNSGPELSIFLLRI